MQRTEQTQSRERQYVDQGRPKPNSSDYGLQELVPLSVSQDKEPVFHDINIVAVHGLGGHLKRTWTYRQPHSPGKGTDGDDGVLWLTRFLPNDLPGARVYSFGYDSKPVFSNSTAGIRDSAKSLLEHLLNILEDVSVHPSGNQHHTTNSGPVSSNRIGHSYSSVIALGG